MGRSRITIQKNVSDKGYYLDCAHQKDHFTIHAKPESLLNFDYFSWVMSVLSTELNQEFYARGVDVVVGEGVNLKSNQIEAIEDVVIGFEKYAKKMERARRALV